MDMDHRTRNLGGGAGRIILLGDGTEVLTDSAEGDMFDKAEEDKDLQSQVSKGQASSTDSRNSREGTPGPATSANSMSTFERSRTPESTTDLNETRTPPSNKSDQSDNPRETRIKAATDSPLSQEQKHKLEH